jgi:hypothetical protein
MKALAVMLGLSSLCWFVSGARADDLDTHLDLESDRQGPAIRIGFQTAIRTGYSLPLGKASGADGGEMSNLTGGQVPLMIDLGGKVVPNLFLGGYLGFAAGRAAGDTDDRCDREDYDCYTFSLRAGLQGHFQLLPHSSANPWIGYGIGYESLTLKQSGDDDDGSVTNGGPEYARIMAGLDFRLSRTFGFGPFVDLSIGKYTRYRSDPPGEDDVEGDIPQAALHEWLTLGARVVFFP